MLDIVEAPLKRGDREEDKEYVPRFRTSDLKWQVPDLRSGCEHEVFRYISVGVKSSLSGMTSVNLD